tara:strand:- start:273 stop:1232 length:960 start_codon:yes stop_codon:yes gene_type:complete
MAITSTYPIIVPKLTDLIVGTQTYTSADPVLNNPTRNFTVASLVSLAEASGGGGISSISGGTGITVDSTVATTPIVSLDYGIANYIVSTPTEATTAASTSFIGLGDGNQASKITLGTIPISALTKVEEYIQQTISGGAIFQSGYNAADNIPDLTSGTGISKGFMYTVTVAGSEFYTVALDVGDVLISNIESPTDVADWTIVVDNVNVYGLSATSDVDKAALTLTSTSGNSPVYIKGSGGTSVGVVSSEIVITGLEIGATGTTALAGNTTTITPTQATAITDSVKNNTNPIGTSKVTNIVTLTSFPPAGVVDPNTLYIII